MIDIVEQLLVDADWLGSETARKAATEIKRLRAEVEQWKERYEALSGEHRQDRPP